MKTDALGRARGQKLVTPVRGPRRRDPQFPRHRLEILPAQQPQHRLALAPGRKPTPTAAPGATDSSTCFLISTLLQRELSRNQVSKKTLGRRTGRLSERLSGALHHRRRAGERTARGPG